MSTSVDAVSQGVVVAGGLIVAVGSQAVFVLKQGIIKNYIFSVCLICFLCDVVLMTAGVMGLGKWINGSKHLLTILFLSGAGSKNGNRLLAALTGSRGGDIYSIIEYLVSN